jgi:hypothetical protein
MGSWHAWSLLLSLGRNVKYFICENNLYIYWSSTTKWISNSTGHYVYMESFIRNTTPDSVLHCFSTGE